MLAAVEATRANFGERITMYPDRSGAGVLFCIESRYWYIDEPAREASSNEVTYGTAKPQCGPFERADFGDRDRFAWPVAACAIPQNTSRMHYWSERFAMWNEDETLVIIDATRPVVMRVTLPGFVESYQTVLFHAGRLWLSVTEGVVSFALSTLEALFDQPAGALTIELREIYPRRQRDRAVEARIEQIDDTEVRARTLKLRSSRFSPVPGLQVGMDVMLYDELVLDRFLEIEVPGQPRRALSASFPTRTTVIGELHHERAVDPAGELVRPTAAPTRQADLDRLFAALADDPDDDATRLVLVDSLEESGQPYAAQLAGLLAGETAEERRRDALGTLASYVAEVVYRGGLPFAGTLASSAPLDDDIGDVVAADQRLGFFHTLRIGDGPYGVYAKLVASPRAVGLRHVDVPRTSVLSALIAGGRRELTRLSGVKFANREMIEGLADATFDRVKELETETAPAAVGKLLEFIARDETRFFARAPRHLVLTTRASSHLLVAPVLAAWDRLPVTKLSVADVTLSRDGTAVAAETAHAIAIEQVRARFPHLRVT